MAGPDQQRLTKFEMSPNASIDQSLHEAPVIFIDGATAYSTLGDTVRFNLIQDRLVWTGQPDQAPMQRVVCARLVMTKEAAHQLAKWLVEAQAVNAADK